MGVRVFISHSSKDKPEVEKLALALRGRGIEPWLDKWEIGPGDDIVASINAGLDEAGAGIIVFSRHTGESNWVHAEQSYLIYARIVESKVLIPVVIGGDFKVPPLIRPLARRGIEEVDSIAGALLSRSAGPPPAVPPEVGKTREVLVSLRRQGEGGVRVEVSIAGEVHSGASLAAPPAGLAEARDAFLRGFRAGVRRDPTAAERTALEGGLTQLGRALRALCLPGESGAALASVVDGCPVGTTVEVCFEADDPALLGLPFEALRLPDDRVLATQASVVMLRRPAGLKAPDGAKLAGPLKVLVAVGAPDEGFTSSAVLDQERELQNILDAVTEAQRHENLEVRILEVGHPEVIGGAMGRDAYHVLHVSCHGGPGVLELENEDGEAVRTTADELVEPIRRTGRPLPLVLLNACHGGVHAGEMASLAHALLRAGVPSVLAMQTSVSDFYAIRFARLFYEHLAKLEPPLASRALAETRKELERERQEAVRRSAPLAETQPEFATASLYVAGGERPLADFGLDKQPLRVRPVYEVAGPVPQLRIDDLIGRRREQRETLRTLRDESRRYAGVVLTGIGGVGKSAVAGRVMQRLAEQGWMVPAVAGRFDLAAIAVAVGTELLQTGRPEPQKLGALLANPNLDDRVRFQLVAKALAEEPVLLVLDDFEQNLAPGGGAFLDPDVGEYLGLLARSARRGRLLLTCRYPVPGTEAYLHRVSVGPLSPAETRKLLQRLPSLRESDAAELRLVLRVIGGHPRMLEFLDAVLRGGQGRLPHVTNKLREVLEEEGVEADASVADLESGVAAVVMLGARDVFLDVLLEIARGERIDEVLLQAAVSNLPVTPEGLTRMLADGDGGDPAAVVRALERLEDLSLVFRFPDDSAWVHRWTAEGLARLADAEPHRERYRRAGRYRIWRVEHESHSLDDGIEAVRNFLGGEDFDAAVGEAYGLFGALRKFQRSVGIAALAAEVLESLPETHSDYAAVADEEAQAHLALGFTARASERYEALLRRHRQLAAAEPDRADYQRNLSVSFSKVGDLYRALGQGEQARQAYLQSLQIRERLAAAEPNRADYQRDLTAAYQRLGDFHLSAGDNEQAQQTYLKSLEIAKQLAGAEPNRADHQRNLSVAFNKVGDLYRALGQGEQARQAYLQSLQIRERLAAAEPDRADYQQYLAVSFERMGDVHMDDGMGDEAMRMFSDALAIREQLLEKEPKRADYQRELIIPLARLGSIDGSATGRERLLRALALVEGLRDSGRLVPTDQPLISWVQGLLGNHPVQPPPA